MRTRLKSLGGFDVTDAQATDELNVKYEELVVASQFRKSERSIATTVAGQVAYALPEADLDVAQVKVGDGGLYERVGESPLWDLKAGASFFRASPGFVGVFGPSF